MAVFDGLVREIHLTAVGIFDDAVAYVVVVGNEPYIWRVALLRQMNELDEFSSRQGVNLWLEYSNTI